MKRALLLAFATALFVRPANAAEATPQQVELAVTPAGSSIAPLLRAELSELGLVVVAASDSLRIEVVLTSDSLEVRLIDAESGRIKGQEVFSAPAGHSMDARTAALHAAEFLRWHLRTHALGDSNVVNAPTSAAPEHVVPASNRASSSLHLSLLPMAVYSPGGTSIGMAGELDLLRRWRAIGARLLGASSFVHNSLYSAEGSIDVSAYLGGLEGVLLFETQLGTALELGAGAALFGSSSRGNPSANNLGRSEQLLTVAPLADVRLRQRLSADWAFTLSSMCLVPLRSTRLRALEREVGRYGQAVFTLGLGVELTL